MPRSVVDDGIDLSTIASKAGRIVLGLVASIFLLVAVFKCAENLDAHESMVIQYPNGSLSTFTSSGIYPQWFGKVTRYPKRFNYDFQMPIRFNDNGHGTLHGSVQVDMPLDSANLIALHVKYSSPDAISTQLIQTVVSKSIYLTGPLMSSKESYAEKRNDLISYIEDQLDKGIYRTIQKTEDVPDPLDDKKTKKIVRLEILRDDHGVPQREELSPLAQYGLRPFNFSIKDLKYEETVENQAKEQQKLQMGVQTSIAEAKMAEQRSLTALKNGEANAAEARARIEVQKAEAVTRAEMERDVAKLMKEKAGLFKDSQILEGEGEAEKRKLVMAADGALKQKLDTWLEAQKFYADAIKNSQNPLVPSVVFGGTGSAQGNSTQALMDMFAAKTAASLGLEITGSKQK
jgi:hypothetical protein